MAQKLQALADLPPFIKKGDIYEFTEPLIPEYAKFFGPVTGEEDDVKEKTAVVNPSRDELKKRAEELGITFASNIPTLTLLELVKEAEEKVGDKEEE